jgi:peroxiredoxin
MLTSLRPSGPRECGPAILCVIALGLCTPDRAGAAAPAAPPRPLAVEARDLASDAPVEGVVFKLIVAGGKESEATSGADGIARFEFSFPGPPGSGRSLWISARRKSLVPLMTRWIGETPASEPPARLLFRTEAGTEVGGRVVDQDDRPVAGAVVVVSVEKKYPGSQQRVYIDDKSVKTDADGRWTLGGVPEHPDSVAVTAYDYLHLTEQTSYHPEPYKPQSALRDRSAILRLKSGTLIEGTVLSPDGQPVAGVEVAYGEGQGYGNAIPPLKTDAEGRFRLGIKPGTIATLIARAPGFGPTLQRLKVGDSPMRAYMTLDSAHSLRGQVVDPSGKPIPGAQVVAFWSGPEGTVTSSFGVASRRTLTADSEGRFEWKEAPGKGVVVDVWSSGFAGVEARGLASDVDNRIVLIPPTTAKATILDRETGQPIPEFSIRLAAAWRPGDHFIWQSSWNMDREAKKAPGAFDYITSKPAHRYLLRVQAEGYLPEDSEPYPTDGSTHVLPFRLVKADPIRGTVRNPDGSPARGGFVYVVPPHRDGWIDYLDLRNDEVTEDDRAGTLHAAIDGDGRFVLPAQKENVALLALTDSGQALVDLREVRGEASLQLRPWARISGTVTIGGKPAANMRLQSYDPDEAGPAEDEPRLVRRHFAVTDAKGRFEFPRVMPGRLTLAEWVPNGVNRRIWAVIRATVDVEAGRTYDLKIGESGRVVVGRLELPRTDDWMIRKTDLVRKSPKGDRPERFGVELLEEGRFRAIDLPPGEYSLRIALHEPPPGDSCGWGRVLGEYASEFTVPEGATSADPPLELGRLESAPIGGRPLAVGDRAPDFALKALDGRELKLDDFRGKYVLLDFWATWCAPCLAEMPNLQAIRDRHADDPRFILIGVSLDDQAASAARMVKALNLSWRQGLAGPDSPVVAAYGATAIPATFLIGPDGTILARDLRGEKTKDAVAGALRP